MASAPSSASSARRDTPWLLPTNRKLHNLQSLSLRNLSVSTAVSSPQSRRRGKTIDDDALPQTLRSPAKLVALREQKHALEHSRSSSDLRAVAEDAVVTDPDVGSVNESPTKGKSRAEREAAGGGAKRPPFVRMRRRSTLEWANATPQRRQERLEAVTKEKMADVFFSLHVEGIGEPVYVSETIERTMNPTFRHVDFSSCGPGITRLDHVTVRVWVRSEKVREWRQLLNAGIQLQSLHFLGRSLDRVEHPLPGNSLIFHLADGVYTSFASLADYVPLAAAPARNTNPRILPTSSFDTLLRLAKLDDSIQDALATRTRIATDLESLLQTNREALLEKDGVAQREDRLKTIDYAKRTVEKQLEKARRQQDEKRVSISTRRKLMSDDLMLRKLENEQMQTDRPNLPRDRNEVEIKKKAIRDQRRRICEDLQTCFPISPIPKQSLAFSIRGLRLPNADDLDTENPDDMAAALGLVAHALMLLAFYLDQPLPYPVLPKGSATTISDPISLLKTNASTTQTYKDETTLRTYPLFSRGVPRFRFDYAVFLLNKDIQLLLETCYSVRVLDIRQTLPNLKYLLYVATAGEGELPARKAGGVRGLLRARAGEDGLQPGLERNWSSDSASSALSGLLWHGKEQGNGKPKRAVESLKRLDAGKGRVAG